MGEKKRVLQARHDAYQADLDRARASVGDFPHIELPPAELQAALDAIESQPEVPAAVEAPRLDHATIRSELRAAISNAYYEARNEGDTMERAADLAVNSVLLSVEALVYGELQHRAALADAQVPAQEADYPGRAEFAARHEAYRCCSFHYRFPALPAQEERLDPRLDRYRSPMHSFGKQPEQSDDEYDEYKEATDAAMNYGQGYAAGLAELDLERLKRAFRALDETDEGYVERIAAEYARLSEHPAREEG